MATILKRAHTSKKDKYTLEKIQGKAIRPLKLYRQYKTLIKKYCQIFRGSPTQVGIREGRNPY